MVRANRIVNVPLSDLEKTGKEGRGPFEILAIYSNIMVVK